MFPKLFKYGQSVLLCLSIFLFACADTVGQERSTRSDSFVGSVSYCLDEKALLTLEQVPNCHFVDRKALTRKIHFGAVVWVKIADEEKYRAQARPLSIHIAPHLIKRIEIFEGVSGQRLGPIAGTDFPFNAEIDSVAGYTYTIDSSSALSGPLYVRIETDGLPFVIIRVLQASDAALAQLNQQIGLGIHLGVLSLMFFVSVGVYWVGKNRVVGCFALLLLNLILATLSGSGLLMKYVWGEYPTFNTLFFNTMFYLRLGFWLLLGQAFLSHYNTPQWYRKSCHVTYTLVALMLCFSWLDYVAISHGMMLFGITLIPLIQVLAIQKTPNIENMHRRVLMGGFVVGGLLIWGTLLITIFPVGDPVLSIYLVRLVDYVNPLVLLLLVFSDYRQIVSQHANTKKENDEIRLRLEFEQKIKNERKVLIDMLTHELKNPLASISLAIGSLASSFTRSDVSQQRRLQNISHSIRNMDAVIERCNLMNQLDHDELSFELASIEISVAMDQMRQSIDVNNRIRFISFGSDLFVTDLYFFNIIFTNLLENALKYSKTDSIVEVNMHRGGESGETSLVISVSNVIGQQGYPDPEKVFNRFYRHPLASDTTGSGVGLYLVQELATLLKGYVHYRYHAETQQVSFVVELPEFPERSVPRSHNA